MPSRRRGPVVVVLAVAASLFLPGCGGSPATGGGSSAATAAEGAGKDSKSVAKGGKDFAAAAKRTAEFGTDAKPGQWPRTIRHAMGTTVIKAQPKRVVVLDVGELDNVVSLGIKPVGVALTEGSPKLPSYLRGAGSPKSVGTVSSLNLEAIAALKPDLILGSQLRAADSYDELSQIAPTVFSIRPGFTWKENYRLNAAALDKTAQAEANLAAYRKRVTELSRKLGNPKPTVSMVRYMPDGVIRLYANDSFIGTILKDLGVPRPKNQDIDDLAAEISAENIDQADADYIFTGVYGNPSATDMAKAQGNPLWKNLKAVKDGHAHDVPDETWYLGLGVTAANSVLDDLQKYLAS
ncbi:ABC transporter substrate-binding protein [Streptomyces gibsoniae]|uniref:Iron-siderophore ABC transporter substrate-binding protein n=1 Tax=Streptomyces gibsoniae TaxID=3075529 RepID=A0ABU2U5Q7_9ACTN|nr:iron-siderophore ABC transporter substrate-binding protein [Streptomyces sp. DSM 41699]MDT0468558.1 iron-siderophore ABC transporter substrate-binding protein [Streptomyces sp. DSM 41699]